jgi:hypothetical protein
MKFYKKLFFYKKNNFCEIFVKKISSASFPKNNYFRCLVGASRNFLSSKENFSGLRPGLCFYARRSAWGGLAEWGFVDRACKARSGSSTPPGLASIGGFGAKRARPGLIYVY